jgi:hypothetical protein
MDKPVNIDELRGRELDAEVARRVMRLTVMQRANADGGVEYVYDGPSGQPLRVPLYCASPAACAQIEATLKTRGWKRTVRSADEHPGHGMLTTVEYENPDREQQVEAVGASFEEAVCRAALKAFMSDVFGVGDEVVFVAGEPKGQRGVVTHVSHDARSRAIYSVLWDNGRTTSIVRAEELQLARRSSE